MSQIFGLNEVILDITTAGATIDNRVEEVVERNIEAVADTYRDLVPRDQEWVARQIDYDVVKSPGRITGEAGSAAWDAHFAEYGTASYGPRPAAGPALDRHSGDFEKDLGDAAEF